MKQKLYFIAIPYGDNDLSLTRQDINDLKSAGRKTGLCFSRYIVLLLKEFIKQKKVLKYGKSKSMQVG